MKVVVLCGGKGTRLGLDGIPKPMVPVHGKPLLELIVENIAASGFRDFVFLNGHLASVIEDHFGDGTRFGVSISHVTETAPLGTAGSFRQIAANLTEPFIVVYGDILFDIDFAAFVEFARERGGAGTLFVHPNDHPHDSDLLTVDRFDRIVQFHPKPHDDEGRLPNLVSAALYVLSPTALNYIPSSGASDWGRDIFSILAEAEALYAYRSCEYAKDVGTPERIKKAERHLADGRVKRLNRLTPKPALFLDRDGVINIERDGIYAARDMMLIDGAAQAIRAANDAGIPVICVTNQPGVAKGLLSWEELDAVHAELDAQLAKSAGAFIDDYFICPHHPEAGWEGEIVELKIACDCRKPLPGLLRQAATRHGIDLGRSWLVGDRYCDIAAANAVGTSSILVRSGHNGNDRHRFPDIEPNRVEDDLASALPNLKWEFS
ncbi:MULTISPECIES: HAD-IIIA family hydrolase [Agrobacterium tumefaciens complex]|jgi:mannose-1-phosphate guanylyltransferase/phosphomannomutase|uniref:D,D-heptose 1,7-bisphosphate phosphatase n=1 Tax=Agrobacterium tumefaciens TaxID=358 RepID=A0AAP9E9M5_AGRTU|nr:HAD-IIIA family hydrolase [Agrobacterium tumefaciens]NSZ60847.1 HAD-IIIA family hydrolase [Agrobacterium tumefaciens]QAB00569.1 HAD-IIIA family hydrolase [Agrobacterium tumefaciens]QDY97182.1 HAD-IIIA family hydrolase [Agrobacterium tumefaciens]UXS27360.1 HAD-IIIA family hydrolase [Agrobacterium tumefaciens]UXS47432.1 HAD-IIIA family hydrolase [Agrobacterium tumefaciens]